MKPLLLFLVAVTVIALAGDNVPPSPAGMQVGRYQIAGGVVPAVKAGDSYATMFRLDTATGQVWQVQAVPLSNQGTVLTVPTWVEVHETNGELYRAAMSSMRTK